MNILEKTRIERLKEEETQAKLAAIRKKYDPAARTEEERIAMDIAHLERLKSELAGKCRLMGVPMPNLPENMGEAIDAITPAACFVYFIQCCCCACINGCGAVKIGFAKNPASRMATLLTSTHHDLRFVGLVCGGQPKEAMLHSKFSHLRLNREWFSLGPDLAHFINGLEVPICSIIMDVKVEPLLQNGSLR